VDYDVFTAFALTLIAGMSTVIGALVVFFAKTTNTKFLSVALAFAAGVMIYISFAEILPGSIEDLMEVSGESQGMMIALLAFFGGIALLALIDKLIPDDKDPHNVVDLSKYQTKAPRTIPQEDKGKLFRTGMFTALAVTIHNFPEGMLVFMVALYMPELAMPLVVAIMVHNIPEGVAVAAPIYYATGSKLSAFFATFLSGLAEPLGALIGYLVLRPFMSDFVIGVVFSAIAGIMVFVSFDELLPSASKYGEHHHSIYGLVSGMGVMALSIWLMV